MITAESTVKIAKDVIFRELEEETVLLNMQSGVYFGLNTIGTRIWQLLSEYGDIKTISPVLLNEYNIDEETLFSDIINLVEELQSNGLIEISGNNKKVAEES